MQIDNINIDKEVLIIAEIGNNHEGDFIMAKEMIVAAAEAGAKAVKFQTIIPEKLVATKQKKTIDMFRKFQFTPDQFFLLKEYSDKNGVLFLSTPFDIESAKLLDPLVPAFKIASGDNNYWPLIEYITETGKPIILSTGMADYKAIQKSKLFIESCWKNRGIKQKLIILHCVSLYPTPPELINLLSIRYLIEKLGGYIGFSDHTIGVEAALMAIVLGACVIEKHFTLDKNFSNFPDHAISMDPKDLALLVKKVKSNQVILGKYDVIVDETQLKITSSSRRSIVAKSFLPIGTKLEWQHLDWLRPGDGLPPGEEEKLLGKLLNCEIEKGYPILPSHLSA